MAFRTARSGASPALAHTLGDQARQIVERQAPAAIERRAASVLEHLARSLHRQLARQLAQLGMSQQPIDTRQIAGPQGGHDQRF